MAEKTTLSRRSLLKALAGLPVLGIIIWRAFEKKSVDQDKKNKVLEELELKPTKKSPVTKEISMSKSDVLRIGIIGFGTRGNQLANGLGYIRPQDAERRKNNDTLEDWLSQENLNVAITGICEVFDQRAEEGLATANNEIRAGGGPAVNLPVKRYRTYHEMLESDEIDAVVITAPDHQHATMSIDAARAGKHVYCEKGVTRTESEVYELYEAVKNSDIVYQLGHQAVQNASFAQARQIIENDILGKISLVETTSNRNSANGAWIRHLETDGSLRPGDENSIDWEQWLGPSPKVPFSIERFYNWTLWFDYGTGLIGQLFSHEFDRVNQLLNLGIPASAVASGGNFYWKDNRDMPDVLHLTFEYPEKELNLTYSSTLSNSHERGTDIMGHDASMNFGRTLQIMADRDSTRFREKIDAGIIDPSHPMFSFNPASETIDAVTSATEKYYAARGLTYTLRDGRYVDVSHLHLKEWIDCIRHGGVPTTNIERAFEEGIASQMAHISYLEKRRTEWDPVKRKII